MNSTIPVPPIYQETVSVFQCEGRYKGKAYHFSEYPAKSNNLN